MKNSDKNEELCAATSPSYGRIWNHEILANIGRRVSRKTYDAFPVTKKIMYMLHWDRLRIIVWDRPVWHMGRPKRWLSRKLTDFVTDFVMEIVNDNFDLDDYHGELQTIGEGILDGSCIQSEVYNHAEEIASIVDRLDSIDFVDESDLEYWMDDNFEDYADKWKEDNEEN